MRQPVETRRADRAEPGHDHVVVHAATSTTAAFAPAKPDDVDTTVRASTRRAEPWTQSSVAHAASSISSPAIGGAIPVSSTRTHSTASSAPAAPRVCPTAPLIEFTGTRPAPKTRVSAAASIASLYG